MPRPLAQRAGFVPALALAPALSLALGAALALTLPSGAAAQSSGAPPGFEAVFDDGRINPHRARRTVAGDELTDRLWTRDVPRRALPHADRSGPAGKGAGGPPPGYAFAFDDGRLNPARAGRSAAGDARMQRIWTQTVPRRVRPGADWGH